MLVDVIVDADVVMVTVGWFDFVSAFFQLGVPFDDFTYPPIDWSINSIPVLIKLSFKLSYFLRGEFAFYVDIDVLEELEVESVGLQAFHQGVVQLL